MRRLSLLVIILCLCATGFTYAADLDNYYLEHFGELPATANKTAFKSAAAPQLHKCGMPIRRTLRSDWKKLASGTQKTLAKHLTKPVLLGENSVASSGGHFIIHYATTGSDLPAPVAPYTVASWVQQVANTFEDVYTKEIINMGYLPPGTPYHVYLQQLAGQRVFGFTDNEVDSNGNVILNGQSAQSYITIDNDFSDAIYHPYIGLPALQITAAHEFHHAIQFTYNYFFETWYAEATSTWMEDEVYDSVNQLYEYSWDYLKTPEESLDKPADGGYSHWIFNRLLAENHSLLIVKAVWEKLASTTSTNGADIPMLPVIDTTMKSMSSSLPNEFMAFARRLYTREWFSHTNEFNLLYSVPLTIKGLFINYPVNALTTQSSSIALPHHGIKYLKFLPSSTISDLTISVISTGSTQTSLVKKTAIGFSDIPVNSGGTATKYSYTVNNFNMLDSSTDEITLIAINISASETEIISVSTDGSSPPLTNGICGAANGQILDLFPQDSQLCSSGVPPQVLGSYSLNWTCVGLNGGTNSNCNAQLKNSSSPQTPTTSGSGGCFIATAAYGSYLDPKVMILREFRDRYLLTNAPGRALVTAYYKISPPLAELISRHELLRFLVRLLLAPVIFTVEHCWLVLATFSLLAGGYAVRLQRRRKLQPCQEAT